MLNKAQKVSVFYDLRDTLNYLKDEMKINAYEYKGFAMCIDSYAAYFKTSLEFLDIDVSTQAFKSNWPIFTNTNDTPPSKYLKDAEVKSSYIANGVFIDGAVENSILGRNVKIGKGAVVKNSILFSGSSVEAGAHLENVIMDKDSNVKHVKELLGDPTDPLYVKEGDIV